MVQKFHKIISKHKYLRLKNRVLHGDENLNI